MSHDVFISYSHLDKGIADSICTSLETQKIRCWIAPRDILTGESWPEAIAKAIPQSRVLVLLYSSNAIDSQEVRKELTLAASAGIKLIPFRIDPVPLQGEWRYHLINKQRLDASNPPTELQIKELVHAVAAQVSASIPKSDEGSELRVSSAIHEMFDDIIAGTIIAEGRRQISKGCNPVQVKQGISYALDKALEAFPSICQQLKGIKDFRRYATLVSGKERNGDLLVEALQMVHDVHAIHIEKSNATGINLVIVEGYQFDRGYLSPYMVNDTENEAAVLYDPYILVTDEVIRQITDILPLLEKIVASGKSLFIIAENIEGEALATLVVNHQRGTFKCAAVKAPGFGDRRKAMLQDIAILTGGVVITRDLGLELKDTDLAQLGRASCVKVQKDSTAIIDGAGKHDDIKRRVQSIKAQIEETSSDFDREKLKERLDKLSNGIAVIQVGAPTEKMLLKEYETLQKTMKELVIAADFGIVPGYGIAYIALISKIEGLLSDTAGDERIAT